ncbi:hypothetical protein PGTUg99_011186 [Puccinia graminis f. sp. tritici]|uniref:Uncharacterized protein n=1 Tax=Puccinia graminis f. sp. tritici TaxID=56615 RepID=A0A5B0RYD5_PUCGR|nr:hypothetical protein PGTUg99_011186 [Puccinia graminis f. sp. tritici]
MGRFTERLQDYREGSLYPFEPSKMTNTSWIMRITFVTLALLGTTRGAFPHLSATPALESSELPKRRRPDSIFEAPFPTEDEPVRDDEEHRPKKPRLQCESSSASASGAGGEVGEMIHSSFHPREECLQHYAWITALQYPMGSKTLPNVLEDSFKFALGPGNPIRNLRDVIQHYFPGENNILQKLSKICAINEPYIYNRLTLWLKSVCALNLAFTTAFIEIKDKNDFSRELGRIFQWFAELLHYSSNLPVLEMKEDSNPKPFPALCNKLLIYLSNEERDQQGLHAKFSDQTFWKVKTYASAITHNISHSEALKTQLTIHFLGNYYKSSNEEKWNYIFESDESFVKLFSLMRYWEPRGKLQVRLERGRLFWISNHGDNSFLPWTDSLEFQDQFKMPALIDRHFYDAFKLDLDEEIRKNRLFTSNIDLNQELDSSSYITPDENPMIFDDKGARLEHYITISAMKHPTRGEFKNNPQIWRLCNLKIKTSSAYRDLISAKVEPNPLEALDEIRNPVKVTAYSHVIHGVDKLIPLITKINHAFLYFFFPPGPYPPELRDPFIEEQVLLVSWFLKEIKNKLPFFASDNLNSGEAGDSSRFGRGNRFHQMLLEFFQMNSNQQMVDAFNLEHQELVRKMEENTTKAGWAASTKMIDTTAFEGFQTQVVLHIIANYYIQQNFTKWTSLFERDLQFLQLFTEIKLLSMQKCYSCRLKRNYLQWGSIQLFPWVQDIPLFQKEAERIHIEGLLAICRQKRIEDLHYNQE